jgi:hypothetical protein
MSEGGEMCSGIAGSVDLFGPYQLSYVSYHPSILVCLLDRFRGIVLRENVNNIEPALKVGF